jgi:hypothetical protein
MGVILCLAHQSLQRVVEAEVQMLPQNKDNLVLTEVLAEDRPVLMVAVQQLQAKEIMVEVQLQDYAVAAAAAVLVQQVEIQDQDQVMLMVPMAATDYLHHIQDHQ